MAKDNLRQAFDSLTQDQRESVLQFIEFLKEKDASQSPFLGAVDEFIEQHPELLRRLAQ